MKIRINEAKRLLDHSALNSTSTSGEVDELAFPRDIERQLAWHAEGMFTDRVLFARLVEKTPADRIPELFEMLPATLRAMFKEWLDDYPLEGGILIFGDVPGLPIDRIIRMKEYAARFEAES